jgi:hypothetical protein
VLTRDLQYVLSVELTSQRGTPDSPVIRSAEDAYLDRVVPSVKAPCCNVACPVSIWPVMVTLA